jgi:hypothetical protein
MQNQQQLFAPQDEAGVPETTGFQAFSAIKLMPGWEGESEPYMGGSSKVATSVQLTDETSAISATMSPDFNHVGFPAASRISLPVTTTPGGGTISRQHVFSLVPDREDTRRLYTLRIGDAYEAQEISDAVFNSLGINVQRGQVEFSTNMIGKAGDYGAELPTAEVQTLTITGTPTSGTALVTVPFLNNGAGATTAGVSFDATAAVLKAAIVALSDIDADDLDVTGGPWPATPLVVTFKGRWGQRVLADMTATDTFDVGSIGVVTTTPGALPTTVPAAPIPSILWDIWADETWAGLGTSKLLAAYAGNATLGDKFQPDSPINSTIASFESLLETEDQTYDFELTVGVDSTAVSLINSFKAGATKSIRMAVEGSIIEGSINYLCQLDFAFMITGRGEVGAAPNSPAVSIPLKGVIGKDAVTGKAIELTLINTVLTY